MQIAAALVLGGVLAACGQPDDAADAIVSETPARSAAAAVPEAVPSPADSPPAAESAGTSEPATSAGSASEPADDTTEVTIADFAFGPQRAEVQAGETVEWVNSDTPGHTVKLDGIESSGVIKTDQRFTHRFDEPGAISYRCELHGNMTGTVVVTG